MKKLLLFYIILSVSVFLKGQEVVYTGSIPDHGQVSVLDMVKTSDDELVIAVDFIGARHFQYGEDGYRGLYKISSSGERAWSFEAFLRKTINDYVFLSLTLDEENNIYGLLYVDRQNKVDIGNATIHPGLNLIKIDSNGNVVWNKLIGEEVEDYHAGIEHKNGNLYVSATYKGELNLEDKFIFESQEFYQCFMWKYEQGSDFFIAKYDTNGELLNAISFGEDYPDEFITVEIDESENIYISGVSDYFFGCTTPYTHITKIDKDLSLLWKSTISFIYKDPYMYPLEIHHSKNGKLYAWNHYVENIIIDGHVYGSINPCLIEIDVNDGTVLRELHFNTTTNLPNNAPIIRRYVNGFLDDFGDNLIVHTAFDNKLVLGNDTIYSKEWGGGFTYNSFVLLEIDLNEFEASLIKKFDGEIRDNFISNRAYFDMPGKIIVDEPYIYFTGEFGDDPLYIYDVPIPNKSGNDLDTDVFYTKIDMSSYMNLSDVNSRKHPEYKLTISADSDFSTLHIHSDLDIKDIKILTIDGRVVCTYKNSDNMNISSLANGVYLLQINSDERNLSARFLISR